MNTLLLSSVTGAVTLDTTALDVRDKLLDESRLFVDQVTNPPEQRLAAEAGSKIQGWLKDVEAAHREVKALPLALCRQIDALRHEAEAPAIEEKARLKRLCDQFAREEASRVAREEQERQRKIAAAQAEADRLAAELKAKEQSMTTEADLVKAIAAEKAAQESAARERSAIVSLPLPMSKAAGAAQKRVARWELLDIHKLYQAAPHLVRMEPNAAAIRACITGDTKIDGLRIYWEQETAFRAS